MTKISLALLGLPLLVCVASAKGGSGVAKGYANHGAAIDTAISQYNSQQSGCRSATQKYDDAMFSGGMKDQGELNRLRNDKDGACASGSDNVAQACSEAQQYLDSHKSDRNHDADQASKNARCNGYKGNGGHKFGNNVHGGHGTGSAGAHTGGNPEAYNGRRPRGSQQHER